MKYRHDVEKRESSHPRLREDTAGNPYIGDNRCSPHDRIGDRLSLSLLLQRILSLLVFVSVSSASSVSPFPLCRSSHHSTRECMRWDQNRTVELCDLPSSARARLMRKLYLFEQHDKPVNVYNLFALQNGRLTENGRQCLEGDRPQCRSCFDRFHTAVQRIVTATNAFDKALDRFDCLPAVDTLSATRPFSPNGNCTFCRMWYARWLTAQLLDIWDAPPCIDWCYSAQLACPHLATSKVVDYAGHPSFQCRDLHISSSRPTCGCLHPCDIRDMVLSESMCNMHNATCSSSTSSPVPLLALIALLVSVMPQGLVALI